MPLIRARDLRRNIKEFGFEQGTTTTLEALLEEHAQNRQHMREMTELLATCVAQVEKMIHVGESMERKITQITRDRQQGEEHGNDSNVPSGN